MFKNNRWLLIALLLFGVRIASGQSPQPGAAGVGDSLFPALGNGGYDVQHYTIDLDVDVDANFINGIATIEAIALQDLSSFNLDLVGMKITGITVNESAATFERDEIELIITPQSALFENDTFITQVTYQGTPGDSPIRILPNLEGWQAYPGGTIVAGEPLSASTVLPVNEHPLDKATYTLHITVPDGFVVASNGLLQDQIDNGDTTTFIWQASDPMASYLLTIGIGAFEIQTDMSLSGVPIINYFDVTLPDDTVDNFAVTSEMMEFFIERFGPYPFESYGAIVVDGRLGFALETQTRTVYDNNIISMGEIDREGFLSHELAHQWFGNSVSVADWRDIWLNEGFATFAHNLWLEHKFGLDIWTRDYDFYRQMRAPATPTANTLFNDFVYDRGGLTLRALQARVGDDVFFDIIRTYHERFRYSTATTADFIAVAEEVSDDDLSKFFQGWLYDDVAPAIPELGLGVD